MRTCSDCARGTVCFVLLRGGVCVFLGSITTLHPLLLLLYRLRDFFRCTLPTMPHCAGLLSCLLYLSVAFALGVQSPSSSAVVERIEFENATETQNQAIFLAAAVGRPNVVKDAMDGRILYWKNGKALIDKGQRRIIYNTSWHDSVNRYTPLHIAALNGHLGVCEMLVKYGYDPKAEDMNELTPGQLAFHHGNFEVAKLLGSEDLHDPKSHSMSGKRERFEADYDMNNALYLTVTRGEAELARKALFEGKELEVDWDNHHKIGITAGSRRYVVYSPTWSKRGNKDIDPMAGWTALHVAAYKNDLDMIKDLLDAGWDVKATTGQGKTPADIADNWETKEVIETYFPGSRGPKQAPLSETVDEGAKKSELNVNDEGTRAQERGGVVLGDDTPDYSILKQKDREEIEDDMKKKEESGPEFFFPAVDEELPAPPEVPGEL